MDAEEKAEHLQHEIELIEHSAEQAAERFAVRAIPVMIVLGLLVFLAWRAGRARRRS